MMDRGADRNSGKDDALTFVSHNGMLTLVKSYSGKPRCITPIILHFILCMYIKFQELNENHLHIYISLLYESY
jgi:hypothetical protein